MELNIVNVPIEEEFIRLVEKHESTFRSLDQTYLNAIKGFRKRRLTGSNGSDLCSILWSYLIEWGNMGRVLGHKGCRRIAEKLKEMKGKFAEFENLTLATIDIDEKSDSIEKVYNELLNARWVSDKGRTKRVGPTATAKVLHLVVPDLFMIWDREIRTVYGFGENGKDYVGFLFNMQNWLKALEPVIQERGQDWGKSGTKVVDAYNWMKCWADKKGL